jgi:hypothetical protein
VDDKPLLISFVDSRTLTATLPDNLPTGNHLLWVENPGGEQALATLHVGSLVFMPLIVTGDSD